MSEEDIKDPDNSRNWVCVSYLKHKRDGFDAFIKKCMEDGKRAPAPVKEKFMAMTK
jgi:hypothetical protein